MSLNSRKVKRIEWWKKHMKTADPSSDRDGSSRESKKSKKSHGENKGTRTPADSKPANEHDEEKEKKRYLIFVEIQWLVRQRSCENLCDLGNLHFDLTKDDILQHFRCAGNVDFRLLTKKDTGRSKGCGFLELDDATSYKKALHLHHSTLRGRKINVEVTCGGGGSGEKRMQKLNEKIKKFKKKRTKKGRSTGTDKDTNNTNSIKEKPDVVTGNEKPATDEKMDNEKKRKGKKRKQGTTEEEEQELASTKKKALKESGAITAIVKELQLETLLEHKKTGELVDSSSDKKGRKKKKKNTVKEVED